MPRSSLIKLVENLLPLVDVAKNIEIGNYSDINDTTVEKLLTASQKINNQSYRLSNPQC